MRARDIMTRSVLSVQPSVPVAKAAAMLAKRGFTALPVTDGIIRYEIIPFRTHRATLGA